MRPTNAKKPINVLTEFITDWIRENSAESLPFDSFEALRGKRIEQKDVERWIFNCNYLYYRFGDFLYANDLLPSGAKEIEALFDFLEAARFKSIKDSNPLGLRSKQPDAVIREFSKDWPPFTKGSRNNIDRSMEALTAYESAHGDQCADHRHAFDTFRHHLVEEAHLYDGIRARNPYDREDILQRCRTLLPIWTAQEINPLYSLLLWSDEDAVRELARRLVTAFETNAFPSYDGSRKHDSYTGLVRRAQAAYLDNIGSSDGDLHERTAADLHELLERNFFSLEHAAPSREIPSWLYGKAQLIWNLVICSIFGPSAALTGARPIRTCTISSAHILRDSQDPECLSGEVLLRRHYRTGRLETVDRIQLDNVQSSGLWKVLGSNYDENAKIPQSEYRDQYRNLGVLFIGTQRFDDAGNIVDGAGDSRFHVEISVQIENDERKRLVLRDLGSKNGTYVVRQSTQQRMHCIVLESRKLRPKEEWGALAGVEPDCVTIVPKLALRRGDIIQLCGSCFEII